MPFDFLWPFTVSASFIVVIMSWWRDLSHGGGAVDPTLLFHLSNHEKQ